jgi:soluble lytic murein transglycosylase-like protein
MLCPLLCLTFVSSIYTHKIQHRIQVCEEVVNSAELHGIDPLLAIAVSHVESGLQRGLVSSAGAVGPMQVMRRFWCKSEPCNLIDAGMYALKHYQLRYGQEESLCRYSSGGRCAKSKGPRVYREKVLRIRGIVKSVSEGICVDGC